MMDMHIRRVGFLIIKTLFLAMILIFTLEDGILDGGFGEKIARFYGSSKMKVLNFGFKKQFLDRYNVSDILKENHLTADLIAEDVIKLI